MAAPSPRPEPAPVIRIVRDMGFLHSCWAGITSGLLSAAAAACAISKSCATCPPGHTDCADQRSPAGERNPARKSDEPAIAAFKAGSLCAGLAEFADGLRLGLKQHRGSRLAQREVDRAEPRSIHAREGFEVAGLSSEDRDADSDADRACPCFAGGDQVFRACSMVRVMRTLSERRRSGFLGDHVSQGHWGRSPRRLPPRRSLPAGA